MKSKSTVSVGAFHPVLFFAGVYIIALIFSIFICSSLFHAFSGKSSNTSIKMKVKPMGEKQNIVLASR